jgi:hypothetical protein
VNCRQLQQGDETALEIMIVRCTTRHIFDALFFFTYFRNVFQKQKRKESQQNPVIATLMRSLYIRINL